jgi:hypothetical protein
LKTIIEWRVSYRKTPAEPDAEVPLLPLLIQVS